MMKWVGNIGGNSKKDKSNDKSTSSVLEGDEEYGKEYDSSDEELVVPKMISQQVTWADHFHPWPFPSMSLNMEFVVQV